MVVGHGPKGSRPAGRLPVFTVNDAEEAERLLTIACPTNFDGEYIAPELVAEQTLDNLEQFSERLNQLYHENHAFITAK